MAIIDGVNVSGTVYGLRDNDTSGGIASTFSASTAYTAGQYVWYDSGSGAKLYRFTVDHAAGAWTETDATEAKLGNDVSALKSAINGTDITNGYINYGYDMDANFNDVSSHPGFKRRGPIITLNKSKTSYASTGYGYYKITGTVAYARNNAGIDGWNTGITLKAGHEYCVSTRYISGTTTYANKHVPLSVYRVGEHATVGTASYGMGWYDRRFTAEEDVQYNIVVFIINDAYTTSNLVFSATLVDLTEINAVYPKYLNGKIVNLQSAFDLKATHNTDDWAAKEYWAVANGDIVSSSANTWGRSAASIGDDVVAIESNSIFKLFILAYENNTYIGTWFGSSFETTYDSSYNNRYIDLNWFRKQYPNYSFKIDATKQSGTTSVEEISTAVTVYRSIIRENEINILNIFGDITRRDIWTNGTINSQGKIGSDSNLNYRLATSCFLRFPVPLTVEPKSGYNISVTTYSKNGVFENQFSAWSSNPYTFTDSSKLYRIVIKPTATEAINPANIANYIEANLLLTTPFGRALSEYANVKVVNHRGYNTIAPENTLPAFEMSSTLGYKYVECDVLFTSDGVPVIMHDDTIDRTCCLASDGSAVTGNIAIDSISYSTLISTYDACSAAQWATWKGVKVPTFAEFMYCCKAMNLHAWVELKWTHTYTQSEIQLIISTIKQYGMEEHVSFISFDVDALALVAAEWDTVELGLNGTVSDAQTLKTGKNRVFMIYNYNSSYSEAITAGFQVCLYTVNAESVISGLSNNGFDSILTNGLLPSQVCDTIRAKYKSTIT